MVKIAGNSGDAKGPRLKRGGRVVIAQKKISHLIPCAAKSRRSGTASASAVVQDVVVFIGIAAQIVSCRIASLHKMPVIDANSNGMWPPNQGHRIGKLPYRNVAGRRIIVWASEVAQLRRFKTDIWEPGSVTR